MMKTFEELQTELNLAVDLLDVQRLGHLVLAFERLGTDRAHAMSLLVQGMVESINGNFTASLEKYHQALDAIQRTNDKEGHARILMNIGHDLMSTGDYVDAFEYTNRALALYEELQYLRGIAAATGNIGRAYAETGDYPAAIERFYKSQSLYKELGDDQNASRQLANIGLTYIMTGDYEEAERQFHECLRLNNDEDDAARIGALHVNMGILSVTRGDPEEAIAHADKALLVLQTRGEAGEAIDAYGCKIRALIDLGRLDEARSVIDLVNNLNIENPRHRIELGIENARLHEKQGELKSAHSMLESLLQVTITAHFRKEQADVYLRLRDLAKLENDFDSYIKYNELHQNLSEEIAGKQATQKIALLESERKMARERQEREKERSLLYGALPQSVAERALRGEDVSGDSFKDVSVMFLDIVGFTKISDSIPPGHVVHLLKAIFKVCDDVCKKHGVTKIKTIGDSYMAVAGVPEPRDDHAHRSALAALELMRQLNNLELTMDPSLGDTSWTKEVRELQVRIGLHRGPVVAGIVGEERLQYDVWGDTVNTASRMESTSEPGRIQTSEAFAVACSSQNSTTKYVLSSRGRVDVKGKGTMETYWLEAQ